MRRVRVVTVLVVVAGGMLAAVGGIALARKRAEPPELGTVKELAFSCDGRLLAALSSDGEVTVFDAWDLEAGVTTIVRSMRARRVPPWAFGFEAFHLMTSYE